MYFGRYKLMKELFLENIKKDNCKLYGAFVDLGQKNEQRVSWEDQNEICGTRKEIDVKSLYWSPEPT